MVPIGPDWFMVHGPYLIRIGSNAVRGSYLVRIDPNTVRGPYLVRIGPTIERQLNFVLDAATTVSANVFFEFEFQPRLGASRELIN